MPFAPLLLPIIMPINIGALEWAFAPAAPFSSSTPLPLLSCARQLSPPLPLSYVHSNAIGCNKYSLDPWGRYKLF